MFKFKIGDRLVFLSGEVTVRTKAGWVYVDDEDGPELSCLGDDWVSYELERGGVYEDAR